MNITDAYGLLLFARISCLLLSTSITLTFFLIDFSFLFQSPFSFLTLPSFPGIRHNTVLPGRFGKLDSWNKLDTRTLSCF